MQARNAHQHRYKEGGRKHAHHQPHVQYEFAHEAQRSVGSQNVRKSRGRTETETFGYHHRTDVDMRVSTNFSINASDMFNDGGHTHEHQRSALKNIKADVIAVVESGEICNSGFVLESHTSDENVGDICRESAGEGFQCPKACETTFDEETPFCLQRGMSSPCRVPEQDARKDVMNMEAKQHAPKHYEGYHTKDVSDEGKGISKDGRYVLGTDRYHNENKPEIRKTMREKGIDDHDRNNWKDSELLSKYTQQQDVGKRRGSENNGRPQAWQNHHRSHTAEAALNIEMSSTKGVDHAHKDFNPTKCSGCFDTFAG